ncbi:hypothetical protein RF007C_13735 [Ruminococcus flavefaciens 007c]|uniref:Uncharacterized protein n=1 Tax=Ruminococcus flavefaciens 007c TaxID=1341157 RepID=W7UBE4_RUMFL|nr:hypothetical protein RF007C_13735 [Ruminococcus flavefaciens 007c]
MKFMTADDKAYWYDSQENASGGVTFLYYNEYKAYKHKWPTAELPLFKASFFTF